MKTLIFCVSLVLGTTNCVWSAGASHSADLRRAVPENSYLAVYAQHNPERDYQRAYYEEIWKTVQETQIIDRIVKIATARMPEADLEKAKSVLQELRDAAAPINLKAVVDCKESVYAQSMVFPTAQHLLLLRLTPEAAASSAQGVKNLFGLVEKYSNGKVPVRNDITDSVEVTTLDLPKEAMFRPTVVCFKDVLLLSSSEQIARQSLAMLQGKGSQSKFDDPRLKEALRQLPEPEDSLTFYDIRQQFRQLHSIGQFVREKSGGNEDAKRVADLLELVLDELSVPDYEVTVEYTEGNRNCVAVLGKLQPNTENKLLRKVFGNGQPFDDWQQWIPADALSYSLSTGVQLHPLYEWIVTTIPEHFPESKAGFEQFEQLQSQFDVHLDRDILQAFSGECVSVTFPAAQPSALGGRDSVTLLRCNNPKRIRELWHRLVDALQTIPFLQAQQLRLVESEKLDGFDEVSATMLAGVGVQPVVGFRDGWMIVGSNAQSVQKVFDRKTGQGDSITETDAFQQFELEIDGPVRSLSYTNVGEDTRQFAKSLSQVGVLATTFIGMAGAQADQEWMKPVQEVLGLLPSLAKIVAKFDFLEAKLSVTQPGSEPNVYSRRSVTLVRPGSTSGTVPRRE